MRNSHDSEKESALVEGMRESLRKAQAKTFTPLELICPKGHYFTSRPNAFYSCPECGLTVTVDRVFTPEEEGRRELLFKALRAVMELLPVLRKLEWNRDAEYVEEIESLLAREVHPMTSLPNRVAALDKEFADD